MKKMLSVVSLFSLLAGCGGGGGGGEVSPAANLPAAYTGNTSPAAVTTSNAKSVSVNAYTSSQIASSVNILGKAADDNGSTPSPFLLEAVSILDESASKIGQVQKSESKAVEATATAQNTIYGYNGYYSYSISIDTSTGSTSGNLTYYQYKAYSNSIAMSGTVTFSGVFNRTTSSFSSFNMGITSLSVTNIGASMSLSGNLSASVDGSIKTTTLTLAIVDNLLHRTTVLKDYTLQLYNNNSLTVAGTYFDPDYGYVVISTITPLTVSNLSAAPTAGRILFTGINGTKARLTFTASGYTVEADTVGNGTFILVQ